MLERPVPGEDGDLKFWLSNFPEETPPERFVELAHRGYIMERAYQDRRAGGYPDSISKRGNGQTGWVPRGLRRLASSPQVMTFRVLVAKPCLTG